jgi:hypothetical protein
MTVMYPVVISVVPQDDFTLLLIYDNNEKKVFDMKPLLNQQPFSALTDKSLFSKVKTSFDTIEWENEIDIDPEYLYEKSEAVLE